MRVLVTGGAGYIGSHAVREILAAGHDVAVLDDLSRGHRAAVAPEATLLVGDLGDEAAIIRALEGVEAVIHVAGLLSVSESMSNPGPYYRTNVVKGIALLEAMVKQGVSRIIFSSTCAVYGLPVTIPMDEGHPQEPVNAYGATKKAFERALSDYARAGRFRAVALRYFNAAGCHEDGTLGEDHLPEEHLIPLAIDSALGRRPPLTIYGADYDTPDGTCVRDYIHVQDLALAHVLALTAFGGGEAFHALNLGTGSGHSVREVLAAVERVTQRPVPSRVGARRAGDPPRLVAGAERAAKELGFRPTRSSLDGIVETAVRWRVDHPRGYGVRS